MLADSVSGYLYKVKIYFRHIVRPDLPHTAQVVLNLVNGLHNKGYDLYVDRFYVSPLFATKLQKAGITMIVIVTLPLPIITCNIE